MIGGTLSLPAMEVAAVAAAEAQLHSAPCAARRDADLVSAYSSISSSHSGHESLLAKRAHQQMHLPRLAVRAHAAPPKSSSGFSLFPKSRFGPSSSTSSASDHHRAAPPEPSTSTSTPARADGHRHASTSSCSSASTPRTTPRTTPRATRPPPPPRIPSSTCSSPGRPPRRPCPPARVADLWRDVQGASDWSGLLDPLHPTLREELIRYGEFAQACYDAFDGDTTSRYCGSCRYDQDKMLESVGLPSTGYRVTKYIYATSQDLGLRLPSFSFRPAVPDADTWSKDSNWVGFVAVCAAEGEAARLGRRDIVVAWRGTVTSLEWQENVRDYLTPMQPSPTSVPTPTGGAVTTVPHPDVKVEKGFYHMYSSCNPRSRYNKRSAAAQVLAELRRLVNLYAHQPLSITVTGHSLGGAMALLCAYDIADQGVNTVPFCSTPIPVTVFNYAAPRVGNDAFRARLETKLGVKVLRVVNSHDTVPKLPGLFTNEAAPMLCSFLDWLPWTYCHVGRQLRLSSAHSTALDHRKADLAAHHNLDLYLHLLDAYRSADAPFEFDPATARDVALVNKYCDLLDKRFRVPPCWWQEQNKGLVFDKFARRWRQRGRDADDVPVNIDHHDDDDFDSYRHHGHHHAPPAISAAAANGSANHSAAPPP